MSCKVGKRQTLDNGSFSSSSLVSHISYYHLLLFLSLTFILFLLIFFPSLLIIWLFVHPALRSWVSEFSHPGAKDFSQLALDLRRNQLVVGARYQIACITQTVIIQHVTSIQWCKVDTWCVIKEACQRSYPGQAPNSYMMIFLDINTGNTHNIYFFKLKHKVPKAQRQH